jgi:hypothetical protein
MRRRSYKIACIYCLFVYFVFLPFAQRDWSSLSFRPLHLETIQTARSFVLSLKESAVSVKASALALKASALRFGSKCLSALKPADLPTDVLVSNRIEPSSAPSEPVLELSVSLPQPAQPALSSETRPDFVIPTAVPAPLQKEISRPVSAREVVFAFAQQAPLETPQQKMRWPTLKRMIISHNGGYGDDEGFGYGTDYSTLGLFLAPDYTVGSFYPFLDLRAHRFDNDTYAFNVGVGGRYIPAPNTFCEIIGFNLFYDWRQGFLNEYNQFGVGVEVLGKRWDFRANGYFPVGAKTFKSTCVFDDYEVGWLAIASKNFLLYTAAGPYYLTRKSCCFNFEPIRGGRIRVRPQYKDYFAVDVSVTHDSTFNTVWQTVFIVSLPFYQMANQNEKPCRLTDRQIYQPIEREEIMSLGLRSCWQQNF